MPFPFWGLASGFAPDSTPQPLPFGTRSIACPGAAEWPCLISAATAIVTPMAPTRTRAVPRLLSLMGGALLPLGYECVSPAPIRLRRCRCRAGEPAGPGLAPRSEQLRGTLRALRRSVNSDSGAPVAAARASGLDAWRGNGRG